MVSVSETSVMPAAAIEQRDHVVALVHGNVGLGRPCGSAPTVFTSRSNTAVTTVAPTTATRTAGTCRLTRGSTRSTRQRRRGRAAIAVRLRSPKPSTKRAELVDEAVGVGREPAELGQLRRRRS